MKFNPKNLKTKKKAKYGLRTKKMLPVYAEDGDIIPGSMQLPNGPTGASNDGYWQNPHDIPQMPQQQPNNFSQGPSSTSNDAPQPIANLGKQPQQKQGTKAGNFIRNSLNGRSISSNDIFAGELQVINALLPYQKPKSNERPLIEAYNPYPQGTNSHASFKSGGKIKKAKNGIKTKQPTQQDSLDVYNNAKLVNDFYKKSGEYKFTSDLDSNMKANSKYNEENDITNRNINRDIKYNLSFGTSQGLRTIKPEEYRKNIDENKYFQRELSYAVLNTDAPMQLFDRRINPQKQRNYTRIDKTTQDNLKGDYVELNQYDPIAVKPWDLLTKDERTKRIKEYGYPQGQKPKINKKENINQLPYSKLNQLSQIPEQYQPQQMHVPTRDDLEPADYQYNYNGQFVPDEYHKAMGYPNKYKNGGRLQQGENGLYINGGTASKIGENMLTGDTIQFNGPSHANGGIDIQYGNQPVEVEGGETAFVDKKGDMNIFGNLHVPGTTTKFKDMGKKIAKEERNNNKMANRGSKLIMDADPSNKFENSTFNTGAVLQDAYEQRQKDISDTKEFLATTQDKMLKMANYTGSDPKTISKMFKGKAKFGMRIAKDGDTIDPNILAEQQLMLKNNPQGVKEALRIFGEPNANKFDDGLDGKRTIFVRNYLNSHSEKDLRSNKPTNFAQHGDMPDDLEPNIIRQQDEIQPIEPASLKPMEENHTGPTMEDGNFYSPWEPKEVATSKIPEFKLPDEDKSLSKPPRPKFLRDKLGLTDVLPELTELFDRAEPVERQQFNPNLLNPYQVSFDDMIAENQGDFNAVQKTLSHNPAALGALAASKYNNDSKIRGEEFRTNQGISNDITNKNTQILNQAGMTNLQLDDEQYVRQAQAEENAKSNRFSAMNSLSNKYAQNRRENTTMRMYEDMYNYGYNPKTGYTHIGPDFQLSPYNASLQQGDAKKTQTKKYSYDPDDNKTEEQDVTYAMGGTVSGLSGKMAGRYSGGISTERKYKKKKKTMKQ